MHVEYSHEQFSPLALAFGAIIGLTTTVVLIAGGPSSILAAVMAFCFLLVLSFFRLRVEVADGELQLRFGLGLIRKTFPLTQIVAAYPVRNRWYYGWGIRLTPHGWLFNVAGLDAVEIKLRSGRKYRIGTDEPEALSAVLNRATER